MGKATNLPAGAVIRRNRGDIYTVYLVYVEKNTEVLFILCSVHSCQAVDNPIAGGSISSFSRKTSVANFFHRPCINGRNMGFAHKHTHTQVHARRRGRVVADDLRLQGEKPAAGSTIINNKKHQTRRRQSGDEVTGDPPPYFARLPLPLCRLCLLFAGTPPSRPESSPNQGTNGRNAHSAQGGVGWSSLKKGVHAGTGAVPPV